MTDGELLGRYARDHSESSFAELVRRHINLIYSAALRQVNNDPHLAEEVVQAVFTDLARKAKKLAGHPSLSGWLYTSTRFLAANARRAEQRRQRHENEAFAMNALLNVSEPAPDWTRLRPLLDEAMHELSEQDRQAVLWRHFENRSYAEIGVSIGRTENAARMRVDRALEKLHDNLARRGVTGTAAALAGMLAAHAVGVAPVQLADSVVKGALTAAAAGGTSVILSQIIAATKTKLALGAVAAVVVAAILLVAHSRQANGQSPGLSPFTNTSAMNSTTGIPATNLPVVVDASAKLLPQATNGLVLHLEIVTADTGKPIPMVPIDFRAWEGKKFTGRQLMSDRFGICDVTYSTNTTELELTTRKDDFADTKLLWRPPNGEIIPTNYILRIERPMPIGGTVLGPDGQPVAGALVGWNHQDDPTAQTLPQSHEFGWLQTATGPDGHWRINRMAADMIARIYGSAEDSNYMGSDLVFASRDKSVEQQLREGTFVFKLGRALTVRGVVTDATGLPVAGAKVLAGYYSETGSRRGSTAADGTFSLSGCRPGKQLVTAEAPGFAATTVEAELADNSPPVQLVLKPGKLLRIRVVDNLGDPIPRANIWYDNLDQGMIDPQKPKSVQIDFNPVTDLAGRAALANAPDAEMTFDVQAEGYPRASGITVRPDGDEHVITLGQPSPVVHGVVWDAVTGFRLPKFRIAIGSPQWNPVTGTTNVRWSTIGRFWLDFSGGSYRQSLDEPSFGDEKNAAYVLKFMADGHKPFVSRVIGRNDGDIEMNVSLERAETVTVAVTDPDGQPVAAADIGLVSPGAHLDLIQGGFSQSSAEIGGSLLRAAANGTFVLPPDDSVTKVIAVGTIGYAESTPAALAAKPVMQLQPWGKLTVACVTNGQPVVGWSYALKFGDATKDINFDMSVFHGTTDARGQFSISTVPPGHYKLLRIYPRNFGDGSSWSWNVGDEIPFEIRPGETTTLNPAGDTYNVTADLQWPAGLTRQPQWKIRAELHTPLPDLASDAPTNEAVAQALTLSNIFNVARQAGQRYQATINADDTLSLGMVQPGEYELQVCVYEVPDSHAQPSWVEPIKPIAGGIIHVSIPSNPPSGTVDAGTIPLEAGPAGN